MVNLWLFVVIFFLTQDFEKFHSDARFYTPARPASNWLVSAAAGWILLGGLVICGLFVVYLWLFVVIFSLHRIFKKSTAIPDFTHRPAPRQIGS